MTIGECVSVRSEALGACTGTVVAVNEPRRNYTVEIRLPLGAVRETFHFASPPDETPPEQEYVRPVFTDHRWSAGLTRKEAAEQRVKLAATARKMRAEGMTYVRIAQQLSIGRETAAKWVRGAECEQCK